MIKNIPEPREDSPTWEHVLRFAKVMESKLARNRSKGDRRVWMLCNTSRLLNHLDDEVEELNESIFDTSTEASHEAVVLEAADVANFAMMVADHFSNDL